MKRLFALALFLTACGNSTITSFEECVEAGYPAMESYPPKCTDGEQMFVQEIGNAVQMHDMIQVTSPKVGEKITMPLTVTGRARGQWFFEANFPVTLHLAGNNEIITYATADGDWMTTDFVPFTAVIDTELPESGKKAALILRRANPSGLPENDATLIVPLRL